MTLQRATEHVEMNDLPHDPKCPILCYSLWAHMGHIVRVYEQAPTGRKFYASRRIETLPDDIRIPLLTAQRLGINPAKFVHTGEV